MDLYRMYKLANVQDFIKSGKINKDEVSGLRQLIGPENQKYLEWVTRMYLQVSVDDRTAMWEVLKDLADMLNDFSYYAKIKKIDPDINKIDGFLELKYALQGLEGERSKKEIKKDIKQHGAEVVYNGVGVKVILVKSKEAACLYGANTQWCISGKEDNRFYTFSRQGSIYIVISKKYGKYAVVVFDDGVINVFNEENDEMVNPEVLMKNLGVPMLVFVPVE